MCPLKRVKSSHLQSDLQSPRICCLSRRSDASSRRGTLAVLRAYVRSVKGRHAKYRHKVTGVIRRRRLDRLRSRRMPVVLETTGSLSSDEDRRMIVAMLPSIWQWHQAIAKIARPEFDLAQFHAMTANQLAKRAGANPTCALGVASHLLM